MRNREISFDIEFGEIDIFETDEHHGFGSFSGVAHCQGDMDGAQVAAISLETFLRSGQKFGTVRLDRAHPLYLPIKTAFESSDHYRSCMERELEGEFFEEYESEYQDASSLELAGRV